ncbi:unnamed protein product [Orchesella dallaii]|uniref:Uncharacterized protein n=1 Tax=Orchesella dallaii TaxID=48710 RepID=A0ABP1QD64_9HEXA
MMASAVPTEFRDKQGPADNIEAVIGENFHNDLGAEAVYQPCSVSLNSKSCIGDSEKGVPEQLNSLQNKCSQASGSRDAPEPLTSESHGRLSQWQWSLRKVLFGSQFFSCCRVRNADAEDLMTSNRCTMEVENLCDNDPTGNENGIQNHLDGIVNEESEALVNVSENVHPPKLYHSNITIPGAGYIENSNEEESAWVIESQSFCTGSASEFLKASGDTKIKTLRVINPPLQSVIKILDEPQLTKNITKLKLENCSPTIEELCLIIVKLTELEHLDISVVGNPLSENGKLDPLLIEDYKKSCEDNAYFEKIRERFKNSMGIHPQKLKVLKLAYPLIWQCKLVSKVIDTLLEWAEVEELKIQARLYSMLQFLLTFGNHVNVEDESSWQDFVTLDFGRLFIKSRESLKIISLSCSDRFPLECLRISQSHQTSVDEIFRWCYICTLGVLDSISSSDMNNDSTCLLFPSLCSCTLHLPFVPVPLLREDELRGPLNIIMKFFAKNNHVYQAILTGLRPAEGMENWIKQSLITIPRSRMQIGTTYCSTTLGKNLPIYDDELSCLAFVIVPEEARMRISEIIEPYGKGTTYGGWIFDRMKCLHIINEQPSLISYGISCITSKFMRLTRLAIEDFTVNENESPIAEISGKSMKGKASLKDSDIHCILKNLLLLEYLHLDCNMIKVTDYGFTGLANSVWERLTQTLMDNRVSLVNLKDLKYLFLRGFGLNVTDKSAMFAFAEEYCMKKLNELHVFAPAITNFGKDKIRKAYAERKGFILRLT